ncbi:phage head closure protein [Pseudomonas guariconensis]|uniref:phage head closure protein n=1 Tax=Pseudomonas guariconensis TaxID=1288410 RepID=UPI0039E92900
MRAGRLRHHCTLQSAEETRLAGAQRDIAWVKVVDLWAEITMPTGRTAAVADRLQAEVSAEILVRHRANIVAGMRLVHKATGDTYLIEASLSDNQRDLLRLLCSNVINP